MNLVSSQSNAFDFFFEHPVQWIHRFNGYITIVSLKKSLLRTRNDLRNMMLFIHASYLIV